MTDKTLFEHPHIREDLPRDPKGISEHNGEGVWSFKTAERLAQEFFPSDQNGYAKVPGAGLILGTCYIWGTVIEHEFGYRSQFASIHSLNRCLGLGECGFSNGWGWIPDLKEPERLRYLRGKYRLGHPDAS